MPDQYCSEASAGIGYIATLRVYLPSNETEEYANIIALVGAGLLSSRAAVTKLGLVDNIEEENEAIEKEVAKRAAAAKAKQPIVE